MGKINCFHCNRKCKGDVLKVGEKYFHKECFTCKVCHKRMENTGFFCKEDSFYCLEDYKRYCASICFSCKDKIVGEVVTALGHTFHKDCFKCSICQKLFLPGDRVSMRMADFLCHICSGNNHTGKETNAPKLYFEQSNVDSQNVGNSHHSLKVEGGIKDSQTSSSVPMRRPNMSNVVATSLRPLSSNLGQSINRSQGTSSGTNLDSSARSSMTMTPKHFHLPQGNGRPLSNSSTTVGSKSHPLALSANNINRVLSNSSSKVNDDVFNADNVKKMAAYPSGGVTNSEHIDDEDWLSLQDDRTKVSVQNPAVEVLHSLSAPHIRKTRSTSQNISRRNELGQSPTVERLRLSEVINRSTPECSTYPRASHIQTQENDIPTDPISASRSPNAVYEPLAPPRYDDHTETSPSRNDDYFRGSNRHLGYSMEYISSTNRSFISGSNVPAYRRSLRNSNSELQNDGNINPLGLKKNRVHSNMADYSMVPRNGKYGSKSNTIPYEQLRVSTLKMIRNINKSNLEFYLSDEEFFQLFQLTRPAFYKLPEWKRNDLKKQVDLF